MTTVSENVYRPSWLVWPVRVFCWPLTVLVFLIGILWRVLGLGVAAALHQGNPERGFPDAQTRLGDFCEQGLRYLTFRSDEFPPLDGRVRKEGESTGPWYDAKRRLSKSHVAMASALVLVLYLYVGFAAQTGWIAAGFDASHKDAEYLAPGEGGFLMGTDFMGKDVFKMTLRGTTTALWIGMFAALISCVIGVALGSIAGYFGGWVDDVIVWFYTTLDSIPYLLLLLSFAYVIKNTPGLREWYDDTFFKTSLKVSLGLAQIIVVIGITSWVGVCRIVRSEYIKHRDREYVTAARAIGVPTRRIIFRHILPNVFHLVLISFSLLFVSAIKFEVILSFLGMGLEPGEGSWGGMISQAKLELLRPDTVWWQLTAATVALFGLVLVVNLLTDAVRDALDPRLRI